MVEKVANMNLSCKKLELDYPCVWKYKLIMKNEVCIKDVLDETIGKREFKGKLSNTSSKGKFISYLVELVVTDEKDRLNLHELFGKHKDIKMIV